MKHLFGHWRKTFVLNHNGAAACDSIETTNDVLLAHRLGRAESNLSAKRGGLLVVHNPGNNL